MTGSTTLEAGLESANQSWNAVLKVFPVINQERAGASDTFAAEMGRKPGTVRTALQLFRQLGMMEMRSEYELRKQTVYYKRVMTREQGFEAIDKHFALGRGFNYYKDIARTRASKKHAEPVAAPVVPDETVAIVGPDAPAVMAEAVKVIAREVNEPEALLEAARQYAIRGDAVVAKVAELEALGITIDREYLTKAIKLDIDPVLEAVSSLLPMVDRAQRVVDRLSRENSELRDQLRDARKEANAATNEVNTLKAANRRLSERNAQLSGQAAVERAVAHA